MKIRKSLSTILTVCIASAALLFTSCEEDKVPTVTTAQVTEITHNSAVSGGSVLDDAGFAVITRGVVWGTTENPTIEGATASTMTSNGEDVGDFTSKLSDLDAETTYYVRAYATSSAGTGYGSSVSFTTKEAPKPLKKYKRYGQMEKLGNLYTQSSEVTYTYNAQGLVTSTVERYIDEYTDVDREITTTYTYNSNNEPTSWTISGDSEWNNGTYTASIGAGTVTVTDPDDNEDVYTLNSSGKATKVSNDFITTTYTWTGPNLTKASNEILGSRTVFNTNAVDPVPQLGELHWRASLNLPSKTYLVVTSSGEESLMSEFTYQFDGDGNVTSGSEVSGSTTYALTYTY